MMLDRIIFLLFKVNQERVNCLFIQVQCASSLRDSILLFYSEINSQMGNLTYRYLFKFCFGL